MARMIRPVSDLRNNFADVSKTVHETQKPVFLTKNGFGDMVVLSMEAFENLQFESEVYFKLLEAEQEEKEIFFEGSAQKEQRSRPWKRMKSKSWKRRMKMCGGSAGILPSI